MVLFKRKVVHTVTPPPTHDLSPNHDVWYIKATGEYFLDYEEYLKRMDFYNQRRFICEITGHSNLSFFDALESEMNEARDVDEAFPESLKEPVLRRLQFSTTSRLDHLVDEVYDSFRNDYYPGEFVYAIINSEKFEVVIREKAQFNAIQLPNGEIRRGYAKYRVEMVSGDRVGQEDFVDQSQITRDRKRFSKSMLRTFMKNTISREPWTGAPWLVKPKYAHRYRIDTNVPPNLQRNGGLSDAEVAAEHVRKTKKKRLGQQAQKDKTLRQKDGFKDSPTERDRINRENAKRSVSTEDLDVISVFDPPSMRPKTKLETSFPQHMIGLLLETWSFFNMFHQTLVLSVVSFDDYIACIQYTSLDQPCELFVELHCSILKQIIGKDSTDFLIDLPARPSGIPFESEDSIKAESSTDEALTNRLKDMQKWREGSWKVRLQRRLFVNGGLELIIVSLLDEVSYVEKWRDLCHEVINFVAPPDLPATLESARTRYAIMPKELKLQILALMIELISDSYTIRERIEFCMEESTRIRRERLETHKEHKALLESIRAMEDEKELLITKEEGQTWAEGPARKAKGRAGVPREDIEASLLKSNSQYKKLVQNIEAAHESVSRCIASLKHAEIELRTLDCQRVRPLGRDRYYNRYWWFEGNGLPTELGPNGYLMGRLWVQGPSLEDLDVFLKHDRAVYGEMSIAERKDLEVDKECQLNATNEWAFYDDPVDIKELYYWLSTKGQREPRFRKDLDLRRARVEAPIAARKRYLGIDGPSDGDKTQTDSREVSDFGDEDEPLRRSSRQREKNMSTEVVEQVDLDHAFLAWRNKLAIKELGKTHYECAYKKTGDMVVNSSVSFATPTSLSASIAGSAKPSPQPSATPVPPVAPAVSTPPPEPRETRHSGRETRQSERTSSREARSDRETRAEKRAAEALQADKEREKERNERSRLKRTASMASIEIASPGDEVRRSSRQTRNSVRLEG